METLAYVAIGAGVLGFLLFAGLVVMDLKFNEPRRFR